MNSKIFLTGFMGSGKTFWGKIWAKENDLEFFDLCEQIEKVLGEKMQHISKLISFECSTQHRQSQNH